MITEQSDREIIPVQCRKIKTSRNQKGYIKKLSQKDGGGTEHRIKVVKTDEWDCMAGVKQARPTPKVESVPAPMVIPEPKKETDGATFPDWIDDALRASKGVLEEREMTQKEQEALIKAETAKLERQSRKGLKIRIRRKKEN